MALKKLILNLDEALIAKLDVYAKEHHVNRTAAVAFLLGNKHILFQIGTDTLDEILKLYQAQQAKENG